MPRLHLEPRLLTKDQAAAYCGLSAPVFGDRCPVKPVLLGEGDRLKRYDRAALDQWIDTLGGVAQREADWIAKVIEGSHGRRSRQRAEKSPF